MEVHVGLAEQEKRANLEPFRQFQVLPIPFPPFEKNCCDQVLGIRSNYSLLLG
jgi:hypothetical protein